jgi:cytochrome c553
MRFDRQTKRIAQAVALGCAIIYGSAAPAAPSSQVAWDVATVKLVAAGNADRGKQLALGCNACHGDNGPNLDPAYPRLKGQLPEYFYKQLRDFKNQSRINPLMNAIAAGMSDRDMVDLAAWYRAQEAPNPATPDGDPSAEVLVHLGDGSRMIPACAGCHGPGGTGQAGYYGIARLGGQRAGYMESTLRAYRAGERANDVYSVMRDIANTLSDAEIASLSRYYAAQLPVLLPQRASRRPQRERGHRSGTAFADSLSLSSSADLDRSP